MPRKHTPAQLRQMEEDAIRMALVYREKTLTEEAENSLKTFLKIGWDVVSPGSPFQDNWHIGCLVEHLEALVKRDIRRLIINLPPRMAKSSIISVALPAWRWLADPTEKFLCASYSKALVLRDSRRTRNLIASSWYQARWSEKFKLAADQNEKGRFENDQGGFRVIASVEGGILGEGGSFAVYDDPNDVERMKEEGYADSVREWYSGSASSRFIDPRTDVRLCVQQRMPYGNDLTAYLLELGGWEQLTLPMEYEGSGKVTSIGWSDPRTTLGELMFPERYGAREVETLKREQSANYQGQYQQRPVSGAGSALRREWFRFYNPPGVEKVDEQGKPLPVKVKGVDGKTVEIMPIPLPSAFEQVVLSFDFAFKDEAHNDFVAGHAWGRLGANTFLLSREHGHWSFTKSKAVLQKMAAAYPCPEKLVEDKANGPAIIDALKNEVPGLIPVTPAGGKWSRLSAISGYVESGNVYLPNPDLFPWVWDLLTEFFKGPESEHDDDTDAMTQALKRMYDAMARTGVPEFRVQPRIGEPSSACHVGKEVVPSHWRRMIAVIPSRAAIWLTETPTGSLRVTGELDLEKLDAKGAGEEIARLTLPEILKIQREMHLIKNRSIELLMPKQAFAEIEPIGSWAELLEHSILNWEPEDLPFEDRAPAKQAIRDARFRSDLVETDDASVDRLRSLLAFQPPDFAEVPYEREKAMRLAEQDIYKYQEYMAATEGKVFGEWPKLKMFPECTQLISQMGTFRRDLADQAPPFVEALLLAVCAPRHGKPKEVIEKPWPAKQAAPTLRNQTLLSRKFALGRR